MMNRRQRRLGQNRQQPLHDGVWYFFYSILLIFILHNVSEINVNDEDEHGTLVVALLIFK